MTSATRPRLSDAAAAVALWLIGLALIAVGLTGIWSAFRLLDSPTWWHVVTLTIGCIAVLAKRTQPIPALTVGAIAVTVDAAMGGSIGVLLVLSELLFAVYTYARRTIRLVVGVVVAMTIFGAGVAGWQAWGLRGGLAIALQLVAFLVIPLWWADNLRASKRVAQLAAETVTLERERADERDRSAQLEQQRAVQAERAAMARELHDVVAGHLSATALQAGAALARSPDTNKDRAALISVRASSLEALGEMRSMILLLRSDLDPTTEPASSAPGLERLGSLVEQAKRSGLQVQVHDSAPGQQVSAALDQTAYRIVAEALTNAAKHAPGSDVVVAVERSDPLTVRVVNSTGAPPSGTELVEHPTLSAGFGLASMKDRAAALGGNVEAGPASDGGWHVVATLPTWGGNGES